MSAEYPNPIRAPAAIIGRPRSTYFYNWLRMSWQIRHTGSGLHMDMRAGIPFKRDELDESTVVQWLRLARRIDPDYARIADELVPGAGDLLPATHLENSSVPN